MIIFLIILLGYIIGYICAYYLIRYVIKKDFGSWTYKDIKQSASMCFLSWILFTTLLLYLPYVLLSIRKSKGLPPPKWL